MSNVSISTNKLSIGYGATIIQRDLSFSLHTGEMVCMLGPNGCGKSTLLRTLAGLQPALSGDYTHGDAKNIALVLTERLSMDNTTVHDVVALGRYPYSSFLDGLTKEDEAIIAESLRQVGFEVSGSRDPGIPVSNTFFNAHSDGEKQRILIAKALAQQTPVILLDEPTAFLDFHAKISTLRLMLHLAHETGKAILMSTHDVEMALRLSDILWIVQQGQISTGTTASLDESGILRQFLGDEEVSYNETK